MSTTFGQLLKETRLERGLTQKELADAIGVSSSYIARLEADERRPSRGIVLNLARTLILRPPETDHMLIIAQHLPEGDVERMLVLATSPPQHPALQAVADALHDTALDDMGREQLSAGIIAYVAQRLTELRRPSASPDGASTP